MTGGFPLVALWHGIMPVWASEIVPACISITKRHFPQMKHLGDITKIKGAAIEPVDIITFGSPCQDLSVAGKRAGLAGERSGLFGEAVRIVEEMREATNGMYPEFAVWENVPGALSSNNGLDFRAVLQAFAAREVPMSDAGKWANAGMVRGGRCDIAWRILDAQYWGVAQRRRRIFLVADFGGERSAEVLLKPEGLRRNIAQGGAPGKEAAGDIGGRSESTDYLTGWDCQRYRIVGVDGVCPTLDSGGGGGGNGALVYDNRLNPTLVLNDQGGSVMDVSEDVVATLRANAHGNNSCVLSVHQNQCGEVRLGNVANTLSTNSNASGRNAPLICAGFNGWRSESGSVEYSEDKAPCMQAIMPPNVVCAGGAHANAAIDVDLSPTLTTANDLPYIVAGFSAGAAATAGSTGYQEEVSPTLKAAAGGNSTPSIFICRTNQTGSNGLGVSEEISYTLDGSVGQAVVALDCRNLVGNEELSGTLQSNSGGGPALNSINPIIRDSVIRRLTPTECERLMGFPDNWSAYRAAPEDYHERMEKGMKRTGQSKEVILKKISDSERYRALGNSVALPCVDYVLGGIAEVLSCPTE